MGARFRFQCPGCGYEARVSGGEDAGFSFYTTTILCEACEELSDAATGRTSPPTPEVAKAIPPECPADPRHPVREWQHPGPCPKCGSGMMLVDEPPLLWD